MIVIRPQCTALGLLIFRVVLQTSLENLLSVNFGQFLGLDGPYLALLGPLLASPTSGLTPLTCGNPVSTRPKQIFDQKYFCEIKKINNFFFVALNWPRMALGPS